MTSSSSSNMFTDTLPIQMSQADRAALEKAGVKFGKPVSGAPLMQYAQLPVGWSERPTDDLDWLQLVDDKGDIRAYIHVFINGHNVQRAHVASAAALAAQKIASADFAATWAADKSAEAVAAAARYRFMVLGAVEHPLFQGRAYQDGQFMPIAEANIFVAMVGEAYGAMGLQRDDRIWRSYQHNQVPIAHILAHPDRFGIPADAAKAVLARLQDGRVKAEEAFEPVAARIRAYKDRSGRRINPFRYWAGMPVRFRAHSNRSLAEFEELDQACDRLDPRSESGRIARAELAARTVLDNPPDGPLPDAPLALFWAQVRADQLVLDDRKVITFAWRWLRHGDYDANMAILAEAGIEADNEWLVEMSRLDGTLEGWEAFWEGSTQDAAEQVLQPQMPEVSDLSAKLSAQLSASGKPLSEDSEAQVIKQALDAAMAAQEGLASIESQVREAGIPEQATDFVARLAGAMSVHHGKYDWVPVDVLASLDAVEEIGVVKVPFTMFRYDLRTLSQVDAIGVEIDLADVNGRPETSRRSRGDSAAKRRNRSDSGRSARRPGLVGGLEQMALAPRRGQ